MTVRLLELHAEMSMDHRRRLAGTYGVTLATALSGDRVFVGSEVPDAACDALLNAVAASPRATRLDDEPPAIAACRRILEREGERLTLQGGPLYVMASDLRAETGADIVRADGSDIERLRAANPGNWEDDEWHDLLDGALGPWTAALVGGRVVSIAHTPCAMTGRAAECGVTAPSHRGRGYAAATTAAWVAILRATDRSLFYATNADNLSSQRVAARLGLRAIGWTWRLERRDPARPSRHPLSRARTAPDSAERCHLR